MTFQERFRRVIDRVADMAADADAMMVSISDMKALLDLARRSQTLAEQAEILQSGLAGSLLERERIERELSIAKRTASQAAPKPTRCETCRTYQRREEVLFEQLRAANIRLEGAGDGAVKLAQGVANLIGSFLPAGTPQPSELEVSKRLGVIVPAMLPPPPSARPSLFQEALNRLPALPGEEKNDG
jgi:hypothetical protein